jgi:hypothetical protein
MYQKVVDWEDLRHFYTKKDDLRQINKFKENPLEAT